jgi:DNA polymerase III gamma/tau subunit
MDTINEQSQQVFRNYIDKYKHNVNLIAVCSNIQKIIESIQSRVNILQIPTLTEQQMRDIMENIVEKENIAIDDASKDYLLKISGRSIRNVINNLEKIYIIAGEEVNLELCKKICSNISFIQFERYLEALFLGNLPLAIHILQEIYEYGYSVIDILDYFFTFMKSTPMLTEGQKYQIIPIICKYITIFHNIHEDSIELAMFTNEIFSPSSPKKLIYRKDINRVEYFYQRTI